MQSSEYIVTDQIYFDVAINHEYLGRITLGLFGEVAPKTVKNFKEIAVNGIKGKTYLGTKFHTAIKKVMILGEYRYINNQTNENKWDKIQISRNLISYNYC